MISDRQVDRIYFSVRIVKEKTFVGLFHLSQSAHGAFAKVENTLSCDRSCCTFLKI